MKKVAIVIPIYKQKLSKFEEISLKQAIRVFNNYDKFFILPKTLQFLFKVKDISNIIFEDKWFISSQTYSALLMNEEFYKAFTQYKYILIYQLDAFVFEDNLNFFCDLGYDYIGAPWISGLIYYWNYKYNILHVGNGGFSLRNVDKCMNLIKLRGYLFTEYINEDMFFSMGKSDIFRVAPIKIALQFSFEREVKKSFELNQKRLPFGCHAWERYDLKFWKPYIESYGYNLDEKYGDSGNEDVLLENEYRSKRKDISFWDMIYNTDNLKKFFGKQNKKIYIWGAGERGRFLGKLLSEKNLGFEGYLDNNLTYINTYIERYRVISLEEFKRNEQNVFVIIAMDRNRKDVANQLEIMGYYYEENYIFYTDIFEKIADGY